MSPRRLFQSIVPLGMLVLLSMSVLTPTVSKAISTTIVISELRTRGPSGATDEFVELYNISSSPINIGGYTINGSNNTGVTGLRATITAGVILQPGCRYLLTNSSAPGYSGATPNNQTFTTGFTDTGGAAVLNGVTIIDQVGFNTGSAYKEGTTLAPTTLDNNQSYERKPGGGTGNRVDTDDNSADFILNAATSNPQNAASPCTTSPTGDAPEDLAAYRVLLPFVRR